jgi:hypothetical protein
MSQYSNHSSVADNIPAKPGEIVDVPINVQDGTGIQAGMFKLSYPTDSLYLEPHVQDDREATSPSVFRGTLTTRPIVAKHPTTGDDNAFPWFTFAHVAQQHGFVWCGFFNVLPLPDSVDEGSLMLLRFKVMDVEGQSVPLEFEHTMQLDGSNAIPQKTTWDDGSILIE